VKQHHEEGREPDDGLLEGPVTSEKSWHSHNSAGDK
jgi:hypothetical protein